MNKELERRIELARAEIERNIPDALGDVGMQEALNVLRAAFPELFTDPPQAWIAPWELTEEMVNAVDMGRDQYDSDYIGTEAAWDAARDAYIKTRSQ